MVPVDRPKTNKKFASREKIRKWKIGLIKPWKIGFLRKIVAPEKKPEKGLERQPCDVA
jgi:hypothetical protein